MSDVTHARGYAVSSSKKRMASSGATSSQTTAPYTLRMGPRSASCGSALDTALRPVAPGKSGASIAEGWAGVLVAKRVFMTPQWNTLVAAASQDEEAYMADDVVISFYLRFTVRATLQPLASRARGAWDH
ncbi:acetylesterase [Pseudoscourfieldia marina]